ncbi:hypothetical protein [Actinomadura fibrosa]|uniref:Oxidoreductase n=1 Tax=Actinomadura fibrosa TaxID=111802 RepID=A0ABW2XC92_9ACTN|nr:hypothetical protein [Actinomadura fibrosa]
MTENEQRIMPRIDAGEPVDLSGGDPPHRTVRAAWLGERLVEAPPSDGGRIRPIKIRGALFTGPLDLEACTLTRPLLLDGCDFDDVVTLNDASALTVRLHGCHLPGLSARSLRTTGDLELNDGSTVEGPVDLLGATIGGKLSLRRARLTNPGGRALNADRLAVNHGLHCGGGFTAEGEVRLLGAHIDGRLVLQDAHLSNAGGTALQANWLTVGQHMLCENLRAEGSIRLAGARISYLDMSRADLKAPGGTALDGYGLIVEHDVQCGSGFTAEGEVRIKGARIGGACDFTGARLRNSGQQALDLEAARADELILLPGEAPDGLVNLTNAQVRVFHDAQATWPAVLRLHGFTYGTLADDGTDGRQRLRWLARDRGGYTPQAYDQLAAAYRRAGREEAARQVAIAKQRHRRHVLGLGGKLANWLLYLTVGYGYRTRLAAGWLAGLLLAGTWIFAHAHPGAMTRSSPDGPAFNAFAYTLDVLLPVIDLGQQKAWQPHGTAMYCSWALIAAGWILTTAVVAGLTGVIKRD